MTDFCWRGEYLGSFLSLSIADEVELRHGAGNIPWPSARLLWAKESSLNLGATLSSSPRRFRILDILGHILQVPFM